MRLASGFRGADGDAAQTRLSTGRTICCFAGATIVLIRTDRAAGRLAAIRSQPRRGSAPLRLVLTVAFFALAFAIDVRTDRHYSLVLGSGAIYGSALALFPSVRLGLLAATAHGLIWAAFNGVRAYADDAGLGFASPHMVSDVERWVFGKRLPSSMLQDQFLDSGRVQPAAVVLGLVHASFFVVPHLIAAFAWWRERRLFVRYQKATVLCFALSLAAFVLLPTAPPWMADPEHVSRITHTIMTRAGVELGSESGETFWFEPNAVAALPSVHVAVAVLVGLALTSSRRWIKVLGGIYPLAMSVSVVYLGEHFVLDVVTGWLVALVAWRVARPGRRTFPALGRER